MFKLYLLQDYLNILVSLYNYENYKKFYEATWMARIVSNCARKGLKRESPLSLHSRVAEKSVICHKELYRKFL